MFTKSSKVLKQILVAERKRIFCHLIKTNLHSNDKLFQFIFIHNICKTYSVKNDGYFLQRMVAKTVTFSRIIFIKAFFLFKIQNFKYIFLKSKCIVIKQIRHKMSTVKLLCRHSSNKQDFNVIFKNLVKG